MPDIRTAFTNAIAAAGQDLLTLIGNELPELVEPADMESLEELCRSLEVRGEPFPRQLYASDPLSILIALEQSGDWSFTS